MREAASFTITRRNGDVYTVLVDADDLERVITAGPWCVLASKRSKTEYVQRRVYANGKRTTQYIHRFLLDAGGLHVDHVNGNGLDNRLENLRVATPSQNQRNIGRRADNASGYKGVSWRAGCAKWRAYITIDGRQHHLGYYSTPELAHAAYGTAATELHGEFRRLG